MAKNQIRIFFKKKYKKLKKVCFAFNKKALKSPKACALRHTFNNTVQYNKE